MACQGVAECADIGDREARIVYPLRVFNTKFFSNLTRSTKFLKDLQKQNGPNAFFGVQMQSKQWTPATKVPANAHAHLSHGQCCVRPRIFSATLSSLKTRQTR
jgi:hypothetical protein